MYDNIKSTTWWKIHKKYGNYVNLNALEWVIPFFIRVWYMLTGYSQLRKQNTRLRPPFDICIKAAELFVNKLNLFQKRRLCRKKIYAITWRFSPILMGVHVHTQPRTSRLQKLINAIRLTERVKLPRAADYCANWKQSTINSRKRDVAYLNTYLERLFEKYLAWFAFLSLRKAASLQICNLRRPTSRFRLPHKRKHGFPSHFASSFIIQYSRQ